MHARLKDFITEVIEIHVFFLVLVSIVIKQEYLYLPSKKELKELVKQGQSTILTINKMTMDYFSNHFDGRILLISTSFYASVPRLPTTTQ